MAQHELAKGKQSRDPAHNKYVLDNRSKKPLTPVAAILGGGALAAAILMAFGFRTVGSYMYFSYIAQSGLAKAGWPGAQVFFRGSSSDGFSTAPDKFGRPFDALGLNSSDYDLAMVDPQMLATLKQMGVPLRQGQTRTAELSRALTHALGLSSLQGQLQNPTRRKVTFMVYASEAAVAVRCGSYMAVPSPQQIDDYFLREAFQGGQVSNAQNQMNAQGWSDFFGGM